MTNTPDEKKDTEKMNLINQTDSMSEDEINFSAEVGDVIFESALVKFIASQSQEKVEEFETFISLHVNAEDFMEQLYKQYPAFAEILDEEVQAMNSELNSLTTKDDE